MQLDITESFNRRLITPYQIGERTYYVLFHKNKVKGPFYVETAPYALSTLMYVGEIKRAEDNQIAGNIFFTQSHVRCEGSFLLAYSGLFKQTVNSRIPADFDMTLVLKTNTFLMFNRKNKATLVVSPALKSDIKKNLEI